MNYHRSILITPSQSKQIWVHNPTLHGFIRENLLKRTTNVRKRWKQHWKKETRTAFIKNRLKTRSSLINSSGRANNALIHRNGFSMFGISLVTRSETKSFGVLRMRKSLYGNRRRESLKLGSLSMSELKTLTVKPEIYTNGNIVFTSVYLNWSTRFSLREISV